MPATLPSPVQHDDAVLHPHSTAVWFGEDGNVRMTLRFRGERDPVVIEWDHTEAECVGKGLVRRALEQRARRQAGAFR